MPLGLLCCTLQVTIGCLDFTASVLQNMYHSLYACIFPCSYSEVRLKSPADMVACRCDMFASPCNVTGHALKLVCELASPTAVLVCHCEFNSGTSDAKVFRVVQSRV